MNKMKEIIKICKEIYEKGDFKYHILPVVKNALFLAEKLKADKEIVEVASYLHDVGRTIDREKLNEFNYGDNEHHITGAKEARKILEGLGYDEEFIKRVENCVLAHRGRKEPEPKTKEEKIVSCADAMSHFDTFLDLFPLFLKVENSFEEAVIEIENKMQRDWNKKITFPEARELVKDKYNAIMLLIKSLKEYM